MNDFLIDFTYQEDVTESTVHSRARVCMGDARPRVWMGAGLNEQLATVNTIG
jgi:hypothetical protein